MYDTFTISNEYPNTKNRVPHILYWVPPARIVLWMFFFFFVLEVCFSTFWLLLLLLFCSCCYCVPFFVCFECIAVISKHSKYFTRMREEKNFSKWFIRPGYLLAYLWQSAPMIYGTSENNATRNELDICRVQKFLALLFLLLLLSLENIHVKNVKYREYFWEYRVELMSSMIDFNYWFTEEEKF